MGLAAGSVTAIVSGAPSTTHALLAGTDPLDASLAAGALLLPCERRRGAGCWLLPHRSTITLSLFWALMWAMAQPRQALPAAGALAGLGVAALDLGLVGSRSGRIRALPQLPNRGENAAEALRSKPPSGTALFAEILVRCDCGLLCMWAR